MHRGFSGKAILRDITLDIREGEFVALIGRSGSGKSTLLRALAGLDDDAERAGSLTVPEKCSVLFQDSRLLPWENALDNVLIGVRDADRNARGRKVLASVGLSGRETAWPNTLSGGEKQRVALARSLVRDPELLLADEPFGALDALTRLRMHALLFDLIAQYRPTVILVTHDVEEAMILSDRVLVMEDGQIILDQRIDLPHPRRASHQELEALRARLLSALGVNIGSV